MHGTRQSTHQRARPTDTLTLGEMTQELLLREVNELVLEGGERRGGDGRELEGHRFCAKIRVDVTA